MSDRGRVRVEPGSKRVRVVLGGEVVADTTRPLLVWEKPHYPVYYFPLDDVRRDLLVETGEASRSPSRGDARVYTVKAGAAEAPRAAYEYPDSPLEAIRGHIAFDWAAMDHWYEEEEEVHVHARNPYTRVDILNGSRSVRVEIGGVTVAETDRPTLLFETGHPTRYYLPQTDVRLDLLRKTDAHTACPYKGTAEYWSVDVGGEVHENVVWSYPYPILESIKIAGLMCFYNEKVDIFVDGRREERPRTVFS